MPPTVPVKALPGIGVIVGKLEGGAGEYVMGASVAVEVELAFVPAGFIGAVLLGAGGGSSNGGGVMAGIG